MRYKQAILVVRFLFSVLVAGLFYFQVVRGEHFLRLSRNNVIRVVSFDAARGRIFDRNGVVLADTIASHAVSVIPQEIKDERRLFYRLSELLDISAGQLYRNYQRNYANPFTPVKVMSRLDKEALIRIEENKIDLPGVIVEVVPERVYPYKEAAAHVLGYLGKIDLSQITRLRPYGYQASDVIGYNGIEAYYDLFLRGTKGGEQVEVDNRSRKVRTVGYKPAQPGHDIRISLDMGVQEVVDEAMGDQEGVVILMEAQSGEIIAMSSKPAYDPEIFVQGDSRRIAEVFAAAGSPLLNRAIAGMYSPGSVFKIVTSAAALEKDHRLIHSVFECNSRLKIGDRYFHCLSTHGAENMREAFMHSCNVYFYNLGFLVGPDLMAQQARSLGLGEKTGVDLKYEARGIVPSPHWKSLIRFKKWFRGDTANMSIGQGDVLVTPLQMVRMAAVFANGGLLVQPHFIKAIGDKDIALRRNRGVALSKEALQSIASFLEQTVKNPEGTAHAVAIEGLIVAGKTGTTQITGKDAHGWFVGYVGAEEPRYAFCVFLEHSGSSHYACVLAQKIFEELKRKNLLS